MFRNAAILALCTGAALTGCSPTDQRVIMNRLNSQLTQQYHECVPLGWNPVPVAGTYYPGSSAEFVEENTWLRPVWLGSVRTSDLLRPETRAIYRVLNKLVKAGMVEKNRTPGGFRYHLTMRALPYYFDDNALGNNPDHIPYLCYSKIVPQRVIWNQPIHLEQSRDNVGRIEVFRVAFSWTSSPVGSWSADADLRSRSVILAPVASPTIVKFIKSGKTWEIGSIEAPLRNPRLVDVSLWRQAQR